MSVGLKRNVGSLALPMPDAEIDWLQDEEDVRFGSVARILPFEEMPFYHVMLTHAHKHEMAIEEQALHYSCRLTRRSITRPS